MEAGVVRTDNIPREMKRNSITLVEKIGAGQFGDVYKGTVNEVVASLLRLQDANIRSPTRWGSQSILLPSKH